MIIYQVILWAMAMLGKSDSDDDYLACQANALEILKIWALSSKRLYELYASAKGLSLAEFNGYTLNDDFAYGEDFAPAACAYIAMVISPETERFRQIYDSSIKELNALCGAEIAPTENRYPL